MTACRYDPTGGPRTLPGRHGDGCDPTDCTGCLPCTEPHCLVCTRTHARTVCAECVGHTRSDLTQVAELAGMLGVEAVRRGLPDATVPMVLMGPAADFEAWAHRRMSALRASNYDAPLDDLDGDPEPVLFTLGSWANLYREVLDKPTDLRQTGPRDLAFLLDNLHVMADRLEPPFSDFAADIRRARGRLEDCLRDGDRDDPANVGCFDCGGRLVRKMTDRGLDDRWTCKRCRRQYTDPEYHLAVRAAIEQEASA